MLNYQRDNYGRTFYTVFNSSVQLAEGTVHMEVSVLSLETHGDLWIHHFRKPPHIYIYTQYKSIWNIYVYFNRFQQIYMIFPLVHRFLSLVMRIMRDLTFIYVYICRAFNHQWGYIVGYAMNITYHGDIGVYNP